MSDLVLDKPSNAMIYYQTLDYARPVPAPAAYMEIDAAFNEELVAVWGGHISPQEAVDRIHERINVGLRRHGNGD